MATITTHLTPADHGRGMTLAEFLDAEVEEGYCYELGRGVVEVTNVPGEDHGQVVSNLWRMFVLYGERHPGWIKRIGGGSDFQLLMPGLNSGRNPDLGVALKATPRDHRGQCPPSLVAEVISPRSGDRDRIAKREEYLAFGIQEYWIVDPFARQVQILIRAGDVWAEQVCRDEQVIPSRVLPGLAATVAELWVDLDQVIADEAAGDEVD